MFIMAEEHLSLEDNTSDAISRCRGNVYIIFTNVFVTFRGEYISSILVYSYIKRYIMLNDADI